MSLPLSNCGVAFKQRQISCGARNGAALTWQRTEMAEHLFDDSTNKTFGVHRLMPEVLATGRYQLAARNPNHLFQKTCA
jgi:hypothetical protein